MALFVCAVVFSSAFFLSKAVFPVLPHSIATYLVVTVAPLVAPDHRIQTAGALLGLCSLLWVIALGDRGLPLVVAVFPTLVGAAAVLKVCCTNRGGRLSCADALESQTNGQRLANPLGPSRLEVLPRDSRVEVLETEEDSDALAADSTAAKDEETERCTDRAGSAPWSRLGMLSRAALVPFLAKAVTESQAYDAFNPGRLDDQRDEQRGEQPPPSLTVSRPESSTSPVTQNGDEAWSGEEGKRETSQYPSYHWELYFLLLLMAVWVIVLAVGVGSMITRLETGGSASQQPDVAVLEVVETQQESAGTPNAQETPARPTYEQALERQKSNPDDVETLVLLAELSDEKGAPCQAVDWYEKALQERPEDGTIRQEIVTRSLRIAEQCLDEYNWSGAKEYCDKVLRLGDGSEAEQARELLKRRDQEIADEKIRKANQAKLEQMRREAEELLRHQPVTRPEPQGADPYALQVGYVYRVSKRTPLMPELDPVDPIQALRDVRVLLPGSSFLVCGIAWKSGTPWYAVFTNLTTGKTVNGWINSTSLVGQFIEPIE